MAFTLTATVSGTSSNSYLTVAEADDFFAARLNSTTWTSATTPTKSAALAQATRRIDQEQFSGFKTVVLQSLAFPRQPLFDYEAKALSASAIPKNLANAVCELALYLLTADDRILSDLELEQFSNYSVGPINVQVKGKVKTDELPTVVKGFLKAIGPGVWSSGTKTVEFVR